MVSEADINVILGDLRDIIYKCYNENANNWREETIKLCQERRINFHEKDDNNRTILFYQALKGNYEFVKYLVALGLDASAIDLNGRNVLYYGMVNNLNMFKELLKFGANIEQFLTQFGVKHLLLQEKRLIEIAKIADDISKNMPVNISALLGSLENQLDLPSVCHYQDNLEIIQTRLNCIIPRGSWPEIKLRLTLSPDINREGEEKKNEIKVIEDLQNIINISTTDTNSNLYHSLRFKEELSVNTKSKFTDKLKGFNSENQQKNLFLKLNNIQKKSDENRVKELECHQNAIQTIILINENKGVNYKSNSTREKYI